MKLTQKDFELFKAECEKWIKRLGLISWTVYYKFTKLDGDWAQCRSKYQGRVATLILNTNFDSDVEFNKTTQIKQSALHEVLELLISPLGAFAEDRGWCKGDYEKETHIVIRTLERVLLEGG